MRVVVACHTCGRADDSPYRVYDDHGKVVAGCVDECHTGRLITPSESARWHARPEAKRIRTRAKRGNRGKDTDNDSGGSTARSDRWGD